jgi:ATP-dependent Lon protease
MQEHGLPRRSLEITTPRCGRSFANTPARPACAISSGSSDHFAQGGGKLATRPADADQPADQVDKNEVADYLGPARFKKEVAFRVSRPGVATGVAWTEVGGDVLFIEATLLPGGNQNIILTGQLGNVMQVSGASGAQPPARERRKSSNLV